jgi:hypothetical protein
MSYGSFVAQVVRHGQLVRSHNLEGEEQHWSPGSVNFNAAVEMGHRLLWFVRR